MRPLTIGCLSVLVVVLIAIGASVYFVYTRGVQIERDLQDVAISLEETRLAFPFVRSQAAFNESDFQKFLTIREEVARSLSAFLGGESEGSSVSSSLDAIPGAGRVLSDALMKSRISPDLFGWYTDLIAFALIEGKNGDHRFRRLWDALDELMANRKSNPSYLMESITKRARSVTPPSEVLEGLKKELDRLIHSMAAIIADDFVRENQFTEAAQKRADPKKIDLLRRSPKE